MNHLKRISSAVLLTACVLGCVSTKGSGFDPFAFLPAKSLIKQECSQCGFSSFYFFQNKKQKGCKYINDTLAKFNEPDRKPGLIEVFIGGLMGPNGRDLMTDLGNDERATEIKKNVNAVLGEKYSPDKMRTEHTLLAETAAYIRKTRAERKNQTTTYQPPRRPQDPY